MNKLKFLFICVVTVWASLSYAGLKDTDKQYLRDNERLVNGGFEQGKRAWTIGVGNVQILKSNPYSGKAHLRVTLTNQILDLSQVFSIVNETGGSLASCRISTTIAGVFMSSQSNGVISTTKLVPNDGKYNLNTVKDVYPSTSAGVKVFTDTAVTGTVDIDDCSYHDVPPGYIQEVSGAQFVGSLTYEAAGCVPTLAATTTYAPIPASANCTPSNITGGVAAPATNIIAVKIPGAKTSGYYHVMFQGLLWDTGSDPGYCTASLSSSLSYENQGTVYADKNVNSRGANQIYGTFKFNTPGDKTIQILAKSNSTSNCQIYGGSSGLNAKFTVSYEPGSSSHVVTQELEKTVKTENVFSAKVLTLDPTTAVLDSSIPGWLTCTRAGVGVTNCLFDPDMQLVSGMNCVPKVWGAGATNSYNVSIGNQSSTGFRVTTSSSGSAADSIGVEIICQKHAPDANKSIVVQGKFEAINSTETVMVEAYKTSAQLIPRVVETTSVIFNQERKDNFNSYDTTTGKFTAPRDGRYFVNASIWYIIGVQGSSYLAIYKNNILYKRGRVYYASADRMGADFSTSVDMLKNDYIEIRPWHSAADGNSRGLEVGDASFNNLTITSSADHEAIVKNLNSNQNVKCQTKFLTADISTDNASIFVFNNLKVGRRYRFTWNYRMNLGNGDEFDTYASNAGAGISSILANGSESRQGTWEFPATSTTLNVGVAGLSTAVIWGTVSQSWGRLCEYPSSYIETTEFN